MKHYFFQTAEVEGKNRLKLLPGQTYEDTGAEMSTTRNVKSKDNSIRFSEPIGTIFFSDICESLGGYFQSGDLHKYDSTAPRAVQDEYNALREKQRNSAPSGAYRKGTLMDTITGDERYKVPTVESDGFYVNCRDWYYLVRNILKKVPTLLTGPTGVGKTEIVALAAQRLGLPFHWYDMGTMIDPTASLLGTHRLVKGESRWDYASFALQVQQPGVILLDELSRAPASSLNLLFPCLDSRRSLPVELACEGDLREIPVHPDCVFIATANVSGLNGDFAGTNELDDALVNRFKPLELQYLGFDDEVSLLEKRADVSNEEARVIVTVAQDIRNLSLSGELPKPVSTRETLAIADLVHDGADLEESLSRILLPLYPGTLSEGSRSIVYQTILKR